MREVRIDDIEASHAMDIDIGMEMICAYRLDTTAMLASSQRFKSAAKADDSAYKGI